KNVETFSSSSSPAKTASTGSTPTCSAPSFQHFHEPRLSQPVVQLLSLSHGKFFCNGFDLDWVNAAGSDEETQQRFNLLLDYLKQLVLAFISLPMPTIAAVNAHAAAGGVVLALCHEYDYVLMRRNRSVLYMIDLDLGIKIPEPFMALFRAKISGSARRDLLLRGLKIKGEEALKMGIVEAVYDGEEEVTNAGIKMADDLAKRNWHGEVYA
ncbi:hypothetical protein Gotri_014094, partial [Gossypium trilobum]|nr:hypothetical protein [Gossypium trilobum]